MASILLPPQLGPDPIHEVEKPSNDDGGGIGGGRVDNPGFDRYGSPDPTPESFGTPASAYRAALVVGVVWILTLFVTLTAVLEFLRLHSKGWDLFQIPRGIYVGTLALIVSSLTIELARFCLRSKAAEQSRRWIFATITLGLVFVSGQLVVWDRLFVGAKHLATDSAHVFFLLITAAHALHLLGGIIALSAVALTLKRVESKRPQGMGTIVAYWHFINGLWICLLTMLLLSV